MITNRSPVIFSLAAGRYSELNPSRQYHKETNFHSDWCTEVCTCCTHVKWSLLEQVDIEL